MGGTVIKAGIVGGTGYTGAELLRLLCGHPEVELQTITSRAEAGHRVDDLFPNLRGHCDLMFSAPEPTALSGCDVVFCATPQAVAMHMVPELLAGGSRVLDLSADFRLRDAAVWSDWYGEPHACPELLAAAVYGLPEVHRTALREARLVACAGCYPTAVQLGFLPLLRAAVVAPDTLIANAASGLSGAGRQARLDNILAEAGDNYRAYQVMGHRHLPEIEQGLSAIANAPVRVTFVPHLIPMIRGIHATLYARLERAVELQALFEKHYADEPFVDVLPAGHDPQTRTVRGTNVCRMAVARPQDRDTVVVTVVEDNLVKGAAGQAIQCMNSMFGLAETTGLFGMALLP